jgi:hypothetical protein
MAYLNFIDKGKPCSFLNGEYRYANLLLWSGTMHFKPSGSMDIGSMGIAVMGGKCGISPSTTGNPKEPVYYLLRNFVPAVLASVVESSPLEKFI